MRAGVVVWLLALGAGDELAARSEIALGRELQVNSYTTGSQTFAAAGIDADGRTVVVWASLGGQDGHTDGIFAQLLAADGSPESVEFQVNAHTANVQRYPAADMAADGRFVVVWQSNSQDGSGYGIFARRFDAAGTAEGIDFQVNSFFTGHQRYPAIDVREDGSFVVAWQSAAEDGDSYGVFARRFDSSGTPLGTVLRANAFTVDAQGMPAVAARSDGSFVVTWQSANQDDSLYGIFARRFDTAGSLHGLELQVHLVTSGQQTNPEVAADEDGNFVVVWQRADANSLGVYARSFDSLGQPRTGELRVNGQHFDFQSYPDIAAGDDGRFMVTWQSRLEDGDGFGIFVRPLDAQGVPQDLEFQVNEHTLNQQIRPVVAMNDAGRFVVAWRSNLQDESSYGVFARRFARAAPLDLDGSGTIDGFSDGLLFMRHAFAFRGSSLVDQAVDLEHCTRCAATSIEAHVAAQSRRAFSQLATVGAELQVNAYTMGAQFVPVLAAREDGSFVASWFDRSGRDQSAFIFGDVFLRRFDESGSAVGAEIQVSAYTLQQQRPAFVVLSDAGGFIAGWRDNVAGQILARRFDASGSVVGSEFQVSGSLGYPAGNYSDAGTGNGGFVVAWQAPGADGSDDAILARRFDAAGVSQGGEFVVNSYYPGSQSRPAVDVGADGAFVVAWRGATLDAEVFARRFDAQGQAQGLQFPVNAFTTGVQQGPAVSLADDGSLVVVWDSSGQDGSGRGVFARRYSAVGTALAAEFQVNSITAGDQDSARVAGGADGSFLVVWEGDDQDGSGVFAQRYAASGASLGGELRINLHTLDNHIFPRVAGDGTGRFVVAWSSYEQDGSNLGVFARRLVNPIPFDIDGNGKVAPLTDGLLVLRYELGFRDDALTAGAVDLARCIRCTADAIEEWIASLSL